MDLVMPLARICHFQYNFDQYVTSLSKDVAHHR